MIGYVVIELLLYIVPVAYLAAIAFRQAWGQQIDSAVYLNPLSLHAVIYRRTTRKHYKTSERGH